MSYDDMDRLIRNIIYNYNTYDHEKFVFNYNKIGGIISTTTDEIGMNYTYTSLAHAPTLISTYNRSMASINLSLVNPIGQKNVSRNNFFNFTIQACCIGNDCWGINMSLDPEEGSINEDIEIFNLSLNENNNSIQDNTNQTINETIEQEIKSELEENLTLEEISIELESNISISELIENNTIINETIETPLSIVLQEHIKHTYTSNSDTSCSRGVCNTIYYSESKFVYENNSWKNIEEAQSLKNTWGIRIDEDPNFPIEIINYNYTSIVLNLSVSSQKVGKEIPLRVYNKEDNNQLPKDSNGNEISKDKTFIFNKTNETKTISIDFSDTIENLLTQEIKWGDASTIITIYDNNSINTDDSYIRDGGFSSLNFGSELYIYILNSSTSNKESLIRFDTSQIPRQALVDEAKLFFYIDSNSLDAGEMYNVSVHSIYHSYTWNEDTITWNIRPQSGTDYNASHLDKIKINNTDSGKYVSWNVTSAIRLKNKNESFYLKAIENNGGVSTDEIKLRSKEHLSTLKPYLNVTYRLKNLISTTIGETPFYTITANPHYIDLEQNQCQNVTWAVNATGSLGNYIFFGYSNKTANNNINALTDLVDVTIV